MRVVHDVTAMPYCFCIYIRIKLVCFVMINERLVAIAKHQQATPNILLILYEYKEGDPVDELNRVM